MRTLFAFVVLVIIVSTPASLLALEALTDGEMQQATAQAGFAMAVDDLIVETQTAQIRLDDPEDATNYIEFGDIKGLYTLDVGQSDTNGDGLVLPIHFDVGSVFDDEGGNGRIMAVLSSGDWDQDFSFEIDSIDWAGTNVGNFELKSFEVPSFQVAVGPHADSLNTSGIDFEIQAQANISEISYTYNDMKSKVKCEEVMIAEQFGGDPLPNYVAGANPTTPETIDADTWEAQGQMKFGDLSTNNPATFDVGTSGNPDETTVAGVINMPMSGSIRIKKVEMGGQNFGQVAIDGIRVHKMVIEFPGRGLGKN